VKVAVIGGAGRMGSWFVEYFASRGHPVTLTDTNADAALNVADASGAERADSIPEAVHDADCALICVPIKDTGSVILEAASAMRAGSVLMEISSVKHHTIAPMRTAFEMGFSPLSLHPMFGPSAEGLKGKTMVVVPVVDREEEEALAKSLFGDAAVIVVEHEEHDRAMAIVLSLTYFMNIALAGILRDEDLQKLKRLAGTTFTVQLAVAEGIMAEDPGLVASLLLENPYTVEYLERYISQASEIKSLISRGPDGFEGVHESLVDSMEKDPDFRCADERRYRAFRALKTDGDPEKRGTEAS
jgi:prephenate dehydrogenase